MERILSVPTLAAGAVKPLWCFYMVTNMQLFNFEKLCNWLRLEPIDNSQCFLFALGCLLQNCIFYQAIFPRKIFSFFR